jgi:hypothetical protein
MKDRGGGRRPSGRGDDRRRPGGPAERTGPIGLARVAGAPDSFDLVHPRCVREAELDYQEGVELWKAGDPEGARDALRYALQACHDNLWVHVALGRIALEESRDPGLARGHFGYAVELVRKSLREDFRGRLPTDRRANRPFYDALDGLIQSLRALGKASDADALKALKDRLRTGPAGR